MCHTTSPITTLSNYIVNPTTISVGKKKYFYKNFILLILIEAVMNKGPVLKISNKCIVKCFKNGLRYVKSTSH